MINVGDKVRVVKLVASDYASHPSYAIGNEYEVKEITDNAKHRPFKYGLDIGEDTLIFFREDEVQLIR